MAYRAVVDGLIKARKVRGLTQAEVAVAMRTDQSQVSKLERSERRLDIIDFVRYCRAIGVEPADFLRDIRLD
ncbi:helix-turn-helix domain-containing protein [Magnetospirillum sp. ME-1]|uniref:helix-turn-helix domain-containing protein n=1 Tax=Magnetospirillum sp. ME-1 TaxID=1639348 RepID=UPI000A1952F6